MTGWGYDETGAGTKKLRWADFLSVPFSMCPSSFFREPNDICLIDPDRYRYVKIGNLASPINFFLNISQGQSGDSGAPVVIWENGVRLQIGINKGRVYRDGNYYGAAKRVSAYLDWIKEVSGVSY